MKEQPQPPRAPAPLESRTDTAVSDARRASPQPRARAGSLYAAPYLVTTLYYALLPLLGGAAAIIADPSVTGWVVMGGWVAGVLSLYLHAPVISRNTGPLNLIALLLPIALLGLKQGLSGTFVLELFLDQTVLECATLTLGFVGVIALGKGISGNSAWKDLGPGLVVILIGIFVASVWGFLAAWAPLQGDQPPLGLALTGAALVATVFAKARLLLSIRDGRAGTNRLLDKYWGLIIAFIAVWIGGLSIVAALVD
ncbi:MAG: hypothetical protein KC561_20690 [Myxococcales bacterium]|nr:hypothetical protein [Myxococcales bacterium]